jgi:hypothetical protein
MMNSRRAKNLHHFVTRERSEAIQLHRRLDCFAPLAGDESYVSGSPHLGLNDKAKECVPNYLPQSKKRALQIS